MKWNVPNILTMARIFCTPVVIALFLISITSGIGVLIALVVFGVFVFLEEDEVMRGNPFN